MRTTNLLIVATLLIGLPLVVLAQGPDSARDEAAIRQIVQYYFDALKNNDAESLKAFHPKAKWQRGRRAISEISGTSRCQSPKQRAPSHATVKPPKILAIDITGGVATAN